MNMRNVTGSARSYVLNCSLNNSILLLSAQGWDVGFLSFTVGRLSKAKMHGSREQPHEWYLWEITLKINLHNISQYVTGDGLSIGAAEACDGNKWFHR